MTCSRIRAFAAFCLLGALVLPLLCVHALPLMDTPSHTARIVAIYKILLEAGGSPFYTLRNVFVPNMAFDVVGVGLLPFFSPAMVSKLFFAATIILQFSGLLYLSRTLHGTAQPIAAAGGLLVYNMFLSFGFLSYSFGIACVFWFLALRITAERQSAWRQFAIGCAMPMALVLCHISAFGIYAIMVGGDHGWRMLRGKERLTRTLSVAAEFIPALGLCTINAHSTGSGVVYEHPILQQKIYTLLNSLSSLNHLADMATNAGIVVLLGVAVCCWFRLASAIWPGVLLLAVTYGILPPHIADGSYVDARIPVVGMMIGLAGMQLGPRWPRLRQTGLALLALTFAVKQLALTRAWAASDAPVQQIMQAMAALPGGAVVLEAGCEPNSSNRDAVYAARSLPLRHAASFAAFDGTRLAAIGWTEPGQQLTMVKPEFSDFKALQDAVPTSVCTAEGYQQLLDHSRALLAARVAAGAAVPPVYLMLFNTPQPDMLASALPQHRTLPGPIEVYPLTMR